MSGQRVLVVEDDVAIATLVRTYFEAAGWRVTVRGDGGGALDEIAARRPAVVVLDVGLPDMDGTDVVRRLRAAGDDLPVLFVTARDDEVDRVVGLELGADDYVTKPFSPRELVARVRAVMRRSTGSGVAHQGGVSHGGVSQGGGAGRGGGPVVVGPLEVDPQTRRVHVRGEEVVLTTTEFDLLHHLALAAGRVCPRASLLSEVWGYPPGVITRTVDVHVAQLRTKLGDAVVLRSSRGVGYALEVPGA